jgi:hypothetical protein
MLVCPCSVVVHSAVAASHTRTVLSELALAKWVPSGLNATLVTQSVCPCSVAVHSAEVASHTRTVLSPLALAKRVPSGLKATLVR